MNRLGRYSHVQIKTDLNGDQIRFKNVSAQSREIGNIMNIIGTVMLSTTIKTSHIRTFTKKTRPSIFVRQQEMDNSCKTKF